MRGESPKEKCCLCTNLAVRERRVRLAEAYRIGGWGLGSNFRYSWRARKGPYSLIQQFIESLLISLVVKILFWKAGCFSSTIYSIFSFLIKKEGPGTSLVVQWLRLQAPKAGGLGSIPGQGTRSRTPQEPSCGNEDPVCHN